MPLEIKEKKGVYTILGEVTAQQVGVLSAYFDTILENNDRLMVNLEDVTLLDSAAAHFFERLYRKSAELNKVVALIGRQNETVLAIMNTTKTNYILSPDRV